MTATELAAFGACELRAVLDREHGGTDRPFHPERAAEGTRLHRTHEDRAHRTRGRRRLTGPVLIGAAILLLLLVRRLPG